MAEVKWIKIVTDVFDDEKILLIESMPEADSIIVIWFKLLTLAGKQNNDGVFLMSNRIPYTDEMLATIFRRNLNTVRLALRSLEQFGMIEIIDNVITIPNWNKHQTLDAYEKKKARDRERIARKRAEQKMLIAMSPDMSPDKSHDMSPDVAFTEGDKERDKDKDKERERTDYDGIKDAYNSICVSLPSVKSLSEARKKAIRARLNQYSVEDILEAFRKAEASDFLKGKNDRNWQANFDWIIKDANLAKILDGNYDGKQHLKQQNRGIPVSDQNDPDDLF
jgi:predicted phage replisome organizer